MPPSAPSLPEPCTASQFGNFRLGVNRPTGYFYPVISSTLAELRIASIPGASASPASSRVQAQWIRMLEGLSARLPAPLELGALPEAASLPSDPLTVMCGHGERAMTGASILERSGREDLAVLVGGPADWAAVSGRALATGP